MQTNLTHPAFMLSSMFTKFFKQTKTEPRVTKKVKTMLTDVVLALSESIPNNHIVAPEVAKYRLSRPYGQYCKRTCCNNAHMDIVNKTAILTDEELQRFIALPFSLLDKKSNTPISVLVTPEEIELRYNMKTLRIARAKKI